MLASMVRAIQVSRNKETQRSDCRSSAAKRKCLAVRYLQGDTLQAGLIPQAAGRCGCAGHLHSSVEEI